MAPKVSSKNYQIEEPLPVSITKVPGASLDIVRLLGALVYIPSCRFRGYFTHTVLFKPSLVGL